MTNCRCDTSPNTEVEIARALNSIPAGQSALPRQVRIFPGVRDALLAALPRHEALELWRARHSQDLGLMLLEMWAYVSDVLSFYDERIANESYLRTSQRAISLRRLVEQLGYIPAPGIAGSVTLATLAEGRKSVELPSGTAFRSDAFGAEPPQVFEINAPASIHAFKNEWTIGPVKRALVPSPTPTFIERAQAAALSGDIFDEEPGKFLIFETLEFGLAVGGLVLFTFGNSAPAPTRVASIRPFAAKDGRTYAEVEFSPALVESAVPPARVSVKVPTVTAIITRFGIPGNGIPVVRDPETGNTTVYLDAVYRQIRPQDRVLVTVGSGDPRTAIVLQAREQPVIVQPSGVEGVPDPTIPVTQVTISGAELPTSAIDLNAVTFHFSFVDGGRVTTVAETELEPSVLVQGLIPIQGNVERPPELEPPSKPLEQEFLLTDPDGNGARVEGLMFFGASGRAQLSIQSDPSSALPAPRYKTPISVFGNVVTATRGETVFNEVLGSGDARVAGQEFTLKKKPLTYTSAPNELGRESSLSLFVDGVRWKEVRTFFNCGSTDRVYIVRHDLEQNTTITFGDGVRGSRVPSGVNNVRATYRFGSGAAAPPAGAIQQLARPVIGLRGVRSPIAATPGKDPDPPETLRNNAPISARLLGRAVSPQDFQALASLEAGVVRATADFLWIPSQQQAGVHVTYIGARSATELKDKLGQFGEIGLPIEVVQAVADPAIVTLTIAADPDFESTQLKSAVREMLLDPVTGLLAIANASIGGQFVLSPLYEALHAVPGVVAVVSVTLDTRDQYSGFTLDAIDMVCPIATGRYLDFTAPGAIVVNLVEPVGPVTATRRGGC